MLEGVQVDLPGVQGVVGQLVFGKLHQLHLDVVGLKQIMEIFKAINQPLSSEQRVRWYKQRKSRLYAIMDEDSVLTSIISEEAQAYFTGDKDLDETVELIQRRVMLFVGEKPPVGQFFSVCGQICGQGVPGRTKQAEIVTRMAGLKQIMGDFLWESLLYQCLGRF